MNGDGKRGKNKKEGIEIKRAKEERKREKNREKRK